MTEQDADWAVAFAIPADTPGIKQVVRITTPRPRKHIHTKHFYGVADSTTIFDDVFVPWERVFLCGETYFASFLAMLFATYHRHSYTGCKPAMTDLILGASALVAEYNGVADASHVKDKLSDLIAVGELVYAAGIAASVKSTEAASGTHIPNIIYTNVGRYHAGVSLYHEYETLADLAGGLPATLPLEDDFYNPEIQPLLEKYIMRKDGVSAENQHRLFRTLSDMLCSAFAHHGEDRHPQSIRYRFLQAPGQNALRDQGLRISLFREVAYGESPVLEILRFAQDDINGVQDDV
jgi:4-hydroxyphenylacetate 3-monooxygenase/4-hydroxybutyryl-CoA dehydratase/vinylacetyl-CoA-Delta-isomerase